MEKIILFICLLSYCLSVNAITVYGHRGARGLLPENTLPAYQAALNLGVDMIDMDVVMTKDKVLVVQHDLALNPDITRNEKGAWIKKDKKIFIKNLSLAQLRTYDVGRIKSNTNYAKLFKQQRAIDKTSIPTLKEVIDFVKAKSGNKIGFQIEIKTDPFNPDYTYAPHKIAIALAKVLQEENIINRTEVQSFDWRCLTILQQINPHITTAYLTDKSTRIIGQEKDMFAIPRSIQALGGKVWGPQDAQLTEAQLMEAHRLGLKVVVWSYPEESGVVVDKFLTRKLISMGVDGIITDRPDIIKKMLS